MTCSLRLLVITSLFALSSCRPETPEPEPTPEHSRPLRGTDFSQLPKIEAEGFVFTDADGNQKEILKLMICLNQLELIVLYHFLSLKRFCQIW